MAKLLSVPSTFSGGEWLPQYPAPGPELSRAPGTSTLMGPHCLRRARASGENPALRHGEVSTAALFNTYFFTSLQITNTSLLGLIISNFVGLPPQDTQFQFNPSGQSMLHKVLNIHYLFPLNNFLSLHQSDRGR